MTGGHGAMIEEKTFQTEFSTSYFALDHCQINFYRYGFLWFVNARRTKVVSNYFKLIAFKLGIFAEFLPSHETSPTLSRIKIFCNFSIRPLLDTTSTSEIMEIISLFIVYNSNLLLLLYCYNIVLFIIAFI